MTILLSNYLEGRDEEFPPTDEEIENAENLLEKVALLEERLGIEFVMTSGYRPDALMAKGSLPGHPGDAHGRCQGIDIHDPDLEICNHLASDPEYLMDCGLWMESPISSKDHLHLQSFPPKSGKRIFIA